MSASVNKVLLLGNLGKDPELKYAAGGMAICTFSLATTRKRKETSVTSWHNIVLFDKTAENAKQYLSKGSSVYVEGEIEYQSWDKDGITKYKTVINCNTIQYLSFKQKDGQAPEMKPEPTPPPTDYTQDDNQLPF